MKQAKFSALQTFSKYLMSKKSPNIEMQHATTYLECQKAWEIQRADVRELIMSDN